jgi:hypothetical protein
MSAVVDYEFYTTVYMGSEADEASFPALCARAMDVVGALTRWADPAGLTGQQLTLYRKAVCAQVDYFAVNGLDSTAGGNDRGFTVGKVSVSGKSGSELTASGSMSEHLSPMVMMYLEQTGLCNPQVLTAREPLTIGWWC